jgi:hypothetical protein
MAKIIQNEILADISLDSPKLVEDCEFRNCEFSNIRLSKPISPVPTERTFVRHCSFINCTFQENCSQRKAGFEDVFIENLKVEGRLAISGSIFKHITFKGKIGKTLLMSNLSIAAVLTHESGQIADVTDQDLMVFKNYNNEYYKNVDWALDISQGEFEVFEIKGGIPAGLILRESSTQALVKYDKIKEGKWKMVPQILDSEVGLILGNAEADCLVIAPVRSKKRFNIFMEAIHILREEGIAELK